MVGQQCSALREEGIRMQPHIKHGLTRVVLQLGSHTFVALVRSRKAVGMRRSVHLFATIALALLASVGALAALPVGPARGAANLPPGFAETKVVSGLTDPTDMEFAPDGRLFVAEQAGRVRIAKPDGTLTTFLNISTKVDSRRAWSAGADLRPQTSPPIATSTSTTPGRLHPPPRFTTA